VVGEKARRIARLAWIIAAVTIGITICGEILSAGGASYK
jgi:hypothetical protein